MLMFSRFFYSEHILTCYSILLCFYNFNFLNSLTKLKSPFWIINGCLQGIHLVYNCVQFSRCLANIICADSSQVYEHKWYEEFSEINKAIKLLQLKLVLNLKHVKLLIINGCLPQILTTVNLHRQLMQEPDYFITTYSV